MSTRVKTTDGRPRNQRIDLSHIKTAKEGGFKNHQALAKHNKL